MDKYRLSKKQISQKMIYFWGSRKLCTKLVYTNFYIVYVVAVSETGAVAPPLLIIPGKILNRNFPHGCEIPGSKVIFTPKYL